MEAGMEAKMTVNGKEYEIIKLLGKGKGGYSYLARNDNSYVVIKQIHHEPCSYYQFGNKMQAEIEDYKHLRAIGIPMPKMLDADMVQERILKEYYIDYECNDYMEEWNFENWGVKYWSKTSAFLEYAAEHCDEEPQR